MTPCLQSKTITVYHGDCRDVLAANRIGVNHVQIKLR